MGSLAGGFWLMLGRASPRKTGATTIANTLFLFCVDGFSSRSYPAQRGSERKAVKRDRPSSFRHWSTQTAGILEQSAWAAGSVHRMWRPGPRSVTSTTLTRIHVHGPMALQVGLCVGAGQVPQADRVESQCQRSKLPLRRVQERSLGLTLARCSAATEA